MLLKKAGLVTLGVGAALMAASPIASATECHHKDGHDGDTNNGVICENNVEGNEGEGQLVGVGSALDGNNILSCNDLLNNNLNGNEVNVGL